MQVFLCEPAMLPTVRATNPIYDRDTGAASTNAYDHFLVASQDRVAYAVPLEYEAPAYETHGCQPTPSNIYAPNRPYETAFAGFDADA